MEGQAELGLFFLLRKRNGFFDIVVKDGSSPAVSCLNFEPRVSKIPSISSHLVDTNVLATIKNHFSFFVTALESVGNVDFFI